MVVVEKSDGIVRVLPDALCHMNLTFNVFANDMVNVRYQDVKDAIGFIVPHSYCCKFDLKMAYSSVGIRPSQYHMSGIKWTFDGDKEVTYLVDTRLMMGASKST